MIGGIAQNTDNTQKNTDQFEFKGNRPKAKQIWDYFKNQGQIDQDFEVWLEGLSKNTAYQMRLHEFGKKNGWLNQDFNTWKNGLVGTKEVNNITVYGENVDENPQIDSNAADNWATTNNDIVSQIEKLKYNPILFTQEDVENGLAKPNQVGNVNIAATNNKIKELQGSAPGIMVFDEEAARNTYLAEREELLNKYTLERSGSLGITEEGEEIYDSGSSKKDTDKIIQQDKNRIKHLENYARSFRKTSNAKDYFKKNYEKIKKLAAESGINIDNNWRIRDGWGTGDDYGDLMIDIIKGLEKKMLETGGGIHSAAQIDEQGIARPELIGNYSGFISKDLEEGTVKDSSSNIENHYLTDEQIESRIQLDKEKLRAYQAGEIDLTTEELAGIVGVKPEAQKYVDSFFPDTIAEGADLDTIAGEAISKAAMNDPRFALIENEIRSNIAKDSIAKWKEISSGYDTETQEGLEKAQNEFAEWYNKSFNEALTNNKEATDLFQQYGIAGEKALSERMKGRDYQPGRVNHTVLNWVNGQLDKYEDDDSVYGKVREELAHIAEAFAKVPVTTEEWTNGFEVSIAAGQQRRRNKIVNELNWGLENNKITKDMTLGEARKYVKGLDNRLNWHDWGWTDDDTVGDYLERKELRKEKTGKRIEHDLDERKAAIELLNNFITREVKDGTFDSIEGFGSSLVMGIDQITHMAPRIAGYGLMTAGTLLGATGVGAAPGAGLFMAGMGLSAIGNTVQGAMEYQSIYMEALEEKMNEEYGEGGYTTQEYMDALASGLGMHQGSAAAGGTAVAASEFAMDVLGAKIGGGGANLLFKNPAVQTIMKNTLGKYLTRAGTMYAEYKLGQAKEGVTEGFQSYLSQATKNMAVGHQSPFTRNIDFDQIITEYEAGKKMGGLFGAAGIAGQFKGGLYSADTYVADATKIAKNIDMSPGASTFLSGDAYFDKIKETIENDPNLSKKEKSQAIQDVSNVRNATIKIPKNITGDTKSKLIDLLVEKQRLESKIKKVNDKDLSATDIARKDAISEEIQTIVDNANVELALDKNVGNVKSAISKASKGKIIIDEVADAKEANAFAKSERLKGWQKKFSSNQGTILQNPKTGEQRIIINRDQALKDQAVNVAGHEFLHGLLFETVKNSPETAINLGNALDSELKKLKVSEDSKYYKRLESYKNDPEAMSAEEKLTLLSDALVAGDIKFNENIFTQIGDTIRRALQAVGLKGIKFNNGRDVYNFIKDFNNSIEKGKLNMAQAKLLTEKAEGDLIADEVIDTDTKAKGSIADVNRRFAEKKWAEDLKKSKDNINTQFGAGTVATIKPNTKWETFKKRQIEKGIDWDGQIAANDETRMQRDFEAVQRDLKKQQKEAKGREFRRTAPKDKFGRVDTDKIIAKAAKGETKKLNLDEATTRWQKGEDIDIKNVILPQLEAAVISSLDRWGVTAGRNVRPDTWRRTDVMKELKQEVGRELWSFMDNFDETKSSSTTYTDNLAKRIGPRLMKMFATKDKSLDQIQEEKGFTPGTTETKDFDETKDSDRGRKKKYPSSLSEVRKKITEGLANEIIGGIVDGRPTGLAKDIISGLAKNIDPEAVAKSVIAQTKDKTVMQRLREAIGKWGTKAYNDFVDKIIDQGLVDTIPAATIKRRLGFQRNVDAGLINYKKIGKTKQIKVKDGKKTYSTPDVYSITKLDKEKLKDYYKDNEKRQQSLFSMLTEGVMAEGLQTLRNDKAFMDRLRTALELKKSPLTADEFMDGLEQKLDQRTKEDTSLDEVTVKSSKGDWLEQIATERGKPSWWYKQSIKENRERRRKIEDLETQYSADELRNKIKTAKGEAKTDLILALEQKFEKFPELVEDSEIDIYTGKPSDKVIAKSAKGDKITNFQKVSYNSRNLDIAARKDSQDFLDPEKGLKKLGTEQQFDKGKTPSQRHLRLTNREKGIRDEYIKRNFKALGPNAITSNTFIDYRTGVFANMDEVYAAIGNGNIKEGKRIVAAEEARYNKEAQKLVKTKESIKRFKEGKPVKQKRGIDIVYLNKDGKVIKSVLKTAQIEQKQYGKAPSKGGWNLATWYRNIRNPEWRELQKDKLKVLKNLALVAEADIKANPENVVGWEAFLSSQANKGTHPIRALAPISFFTRIMQGAQVAEHTLPANQVSTMILEMAMKGNVNKDFDGSIGKNYMQGKITQKMDEAVDVIPEGQKKSLKVDMPNAFFNMLDPVTWIRYVEKSVNARKGGLNLNTVIVWDNDGNTQTLTESYGVSLTPAQYNMPKGSPRAGRVNQNLIQEQNNFIFDMFVKGEPTAEVAKEKLTANYNLKTQRAKTDMVAKSSKGFGDQIFDEEATSTAHKETMLNSLKTRVLASKPNRPAKGISIFDFDDTLADTKEKVIVIDKDGKRSEISASQFAKTADILVEGGASFDFSNFEKVAKGTKKGPLADIALKRQGKFGSGDIFVLTARPQSAAPAIKQFLDSIGLDIPLENITGLADGTAQAKVDFVLNKTAEGYNDFYFADDSIPNVKAVKEILNEIDVKSDTVIAKASKQDSLSEDFNNQIEEVTGKEAFKKYSDVRGRLEGKRKDAGLFKKFLKQFTITPSAEDFMGLMYDVIGKGEQGNKHMKFIKDNLVDPYNKAEQELLSAKVAVANDFEALKKKFPTLRSTVKGNPLMSEIGVGPYTKSQAVRVYNWAKQGLEIPGISKADVKRLVKAVETDPELNIFADELGLINKDGKYPAPENNWLAGDISSDLLRSVDTVLRTELMSEFNENVDIIFSEENKNKLRALYGNKWVEALEDSIRRMKSGSNRPVYVGGGSRIVNNMLDWLNGSVGAVMFINVKSGLLQLISNVNFINWGDNNIYAAAKAFVSADYWPTVMKLLNSDYLVNRRDGLKINVNEAELADAGRKGGIKGAISYLLDKGFIITRIMDSLAIATGGATFYINRVKSLLNRVNPETGKKYTQAEAEAKAFDDFYAISEESQQSSNPSKISQQQASMFGRVILSFQNVTMQYNRLTKKAIRDLYNRRKMPGMTQRESDLSNISKIVYYTTVQNLVFNALQQAIFALAFNDEGDEEEKDKTADILHGMADSLLFGLGFGGAIVSTVKNVAREILSQSERKSPDYEEAVWEVFNISPVLDSKVRKLRTTAKTYSWNMKDIKKRGWSLDNPSYLAISQLISAATNIPIDRVMRKVMNMRQAMDDNTRTWQRIALMLGYSGWSLGLPYWGLESTITREAEEEEKIQKQYKTDAKRLRDQGYKRVPLTGPKSGKPKGELGVDYIQVERPTGILEYWIKPKK